MFMPIAGRTVGELSARCVLPPHATVVEMGNQSYAIDPVTIKEILGFAKNNPGHQVNINALKTLSFKEPAKHPSDPRAPVVADFFKALGFSSYTAIDINNAHGSIVMDLNQDLDELYGYTDQFDLVTNIGVSEHLFNQSIFFKNAHTLCKEEGFMLHILPFTGFVNHGFFNYQPRLLEDLAYANDYEVVDLSIVDRKTKLLDLVNQSELGTFFYHYIHTLPSNAYGNTLILAIFRKKKNQPFIFPMQGKYLEDITSEKLKRSYALQPMYRRPTPTAGLFVPEIMRGKEYILRKLWRRAKLSMLKVLAVLQKLIIKYL